jgi:hypothetical protein
MMRKRSLLPNRKMFHKIKWNKNLQKNVSMAIRLKLKRLFRREKNS